MTVVGVVGAMFGLGCMGVIYGLRTQPPSLDGLVATLNRPVEPTSGPGRSLGMRERWGRAVVSQLNQSTLARRPKWKVVHGCLAITGESAERLASVVLVATGACLLGPPMLWIVATLAGLAMPIAVPIVVVLIAVPSAIGLPIASLFERARDRRRHFRVVISSFVDLVVLSLAGGVGVEGALMAASQVSSDWAVQRMARALSKARDGGQSPWVALGQLGEDLDVPELVELSSSLQLAGTEGARIRQSLSARAVTLRRHEQADAESSANSMTERLFLPGALLLVGFLLFVGYPAFSRILGGFS